MLLPMRQIFQEMAARKAEIGFDYSGCGVGDPLYRCYVGGR